MKTTVFPPSTRVPDILRAAAATTTRARVRPSWTCSACVAKRQLSSQTRTDDPDESDDPLPRLPFRFETGYALFAKRSPRPFPPPFASPPSVSFSDPLSTHHRNRDRRAVVNGRLIKGRTNGDDAVYASEYFIGTNDGVGAWSQRKRGHAGLWSRLVLHFWVTALERDLAAKHGTVPDFRPDPIANLQEAYERTVEATSAPNDWQGTTTVSGAQLYYKLEEDSGHIQKAPSPVVYVTNLGDCQVMVLRPGAEDAERAVVYKTTEQWHWFDCPRQLGTNSPDTPRANAVVDVVDVRVGDVVLAMSDGVIDNLWEHEIVESVRTSIRRWEAGEGGPGSGDDSQGRGNRKGGTGGGMAFAAHELMSAAKKIAVDPFAESPYMEHAIEEGLASEGGKLDDISVVAALCVKNDTE